MQHLHPVQDPSHRPASVAKSQPVPLESDENALGSLLVDLSGDLRFVSGELILTNRRLLARVDDGNEALGSETAWVSWRLDEPAADRLRLRHTDHGGIGALELHDDLCRLAIWR